MYKLMNRTAWALALGLPAVAIAAVLLAAGRPLAAGESQRAVTRWAPKVVASDSGDAYLGVHIEEETDLADGGARVTEVVEGSPADRAGIRSGDVVVRFGDDTIRGPVALTERIHSRKPGEVVAVTVLRAGQKQVLEVELGERTEVWRGLAGVPDAEQLEEQLKELGQSLGKLRCEGDDCNMRFFAPGGMAFNCEGDDCMPLLRSWGRRPVLGVQLVEVTPELRLHLGGAEDRGVLVSRVVAGSAAAKSGIEVGDLIVAVAGAPIADTGDLRDALREREGQTFEIEVVRDRRRTTLSVTLPAPEEDEVTGPQARMFRDQQRALARELTAQVREARRAAVAEAGEARRAALQEAVRAQRDAARAAREAAREAQRQRALWMRQLNEI